MANAHAAIIDGHTVGEFYREIDGYWVFEPDTKPGYWNEYILMRIMYDLRVLNAAWDLSIMTDPKISNLGQPGYDETKEIEELIDAKSGVHKVGDGM